MWISMHGSPQGRPWQFCQSQPSHHLPCIPAPPPILRPTTTTIPSTTYVRTHPTPSPLSAFVREGAWGVMGKFQIPGHIASNLF